jgi:hypothetical protein
VDLLRELTHFLNAFHPAPKTITFEGRESLIYYAVKEYFDDWYRN